MPYCQSCGTMQDSDALFCSNCGDYLKSSTAGSNHPNQYASSSNSYSQPPKIGFVNQNTGYSGYQRDNYNQNNFQSNIKTRTTELTLVLVLQYIGAGILGFISLLFFAMSPIVGLIIIILAGLFFWLIYSVQQFNNTARWIMIILIALGLLDSLSGFNIIGLALGALQIYVLAFHEPTVRLFTNNQASNNYYQKRYY